MGGPPKKTRREKLKEYYTREGEKYIIVLGKLLKPRRREREKN